MKVLLVIDRKNGQTERIPENDANFHESILGAAQQNAMSVVDAYASLACGDEIITCGYIRKIIEE